MEIIDYTWSTNALNAERKTCNQRQLAETVRNKLRNMLRDEPATNDKLVRDLNEMYADMVQLNELRKTNKTW